MIQSKVVVVCFVLLLFCNLFWTDVWVDTLAIRLCASAFLSFIAPARARGGASAALHDTHQK